jgi:hypothetical protein
MNGGAGQTWGQVDRQNVQGILKYGAQNSNKNPHRLGVYGIIPAGKVKEKNNIMKPIVFISLMLFLGACAKLPCCYMNRSYLKKDVDYSKNKIDIKGLYCLNQITDTITKGETGIVSGYIYSRLTGEKLNGVVNAIGVKDTTGVIVNENGYFLLELPIREYMLDVTDIEYMNTKTKKFLLNKNSKLTFNFYLGTIIQH